MTGMSVAVTFIDIWKKIQKVSTLNENLVYLWQKPKQLFKIHHKKKNMEKSSLNQRV